MALAFNPCIWEAEAGGWSQVACAVKLDPVLEEEKGKQMSCGSHHFLSTLVKTIGSEWVIPGKYLLPSEPSEFLSFWWLHRKFFSLISNQVFISLNFDLFLEGMCMHLIGSGIDLDFASLSSFLMIILWRYWMHAFNPVKSYFLLWLENLYFSEKKNIGNSVQL